MSAFNFERFVALRYLLGAQGRAEGKQFLRFVIYAAVGGVAIGVATLLLALSIVHGFSREIEAKIIGFGAHVQVESLRAQPIEDAGEMAGRLAAFPAVEHVAPVVTEFILLRRSSTDIDGVALWGTDRLPPYLEEQLVAGTARFAPDAGGRPGLVIGRELARQLGLSVGDRVTAFSTRTLDGDAFATLTRRPHVKPFHVAGIYETALADYDEVYVFSGLEPARDLLGYGPDEVSRFDLMLHDIERVEEVAGDIEAWYGFPIVARTVYEVFRGLFAWVDLQERIIPVVLCVIIIVAAFNIVGTLLMIILEKTREVGILASMGASGRMLRRLFLGLGLLIGLIGTGIGQVLALGLALIQQRYAVIPLPAEAYYMDTAPIALQPLDFALVGAVALALCALAAYIPARIAARIEPVRVIRFR